MANAPDIRLAERTMEGKMSLKLAVYLLGGLLLWLGIYGYLKTRGSVAYSPTPDTPADLIYQICGLVGRIALLAYLVTMVIVFEWWIAIVFLVIGGLLTGAIYSRVATAGAALAIIAVPLGIIVAAIGLLL
jgi:hypothetical protein